MRHTSCPSPKSTNPVPVSVRETTAPAGAPRGTRLDTPSAVTSYSVNVMVPKREGSGSTPFWRTCSDHTPADPLAGEWQLAVVELVTCSELSIVTAEVRDVKWHVPSTRLLW